MQKMRYIGNTPNPGKIDKFLRESEVIL